MGNRDSLFVIPICIICEGAEEYDYLFRIRDLNVWDGKYKVDLFNAEGNGNLLARYQDKYQNGVYDLVLIFCDTDKKPFEQYRDIKRKIDQLHGVEGISDEVVMYGNPCTMQIILLHWCKVILNSSSKKKNALIIEKCTGIKGYDARQEERVQMMCAIGIDNYEKMLERVGELPKDDQTLGSSNFDVFMKNLSSPDSKWIDRINELIS